MDGRRIVSFMMAAFVTAAMLGGCGSGGSGGKSALSKSDATAELNALMKNVDVKETAKPVLDIYSEETALTDTLAPISTFPLTVEGDGDVNVEIAAATEMSSDAPDDWLNVVARAFNKEKMKIGKKTVSASVRKITSGEAVTYISAGAYAPEVFVPSNYAWGRMLKASGVGIEKIEDRIAGNTAGILMKKDVWNEFKDKYGDATVGNVLDATLNGDLTFAYTNPYTSSTGLNILTAMLKSFDEDDPLSEEASEKLLEYQKSSPPVAYTTAALRQSAAKGVVNAMVMEEQAYVNSPELKGYVYIPAGIRHDHPFYVFDYDSEEEKQAARMFADYCLSDESQKLASEKGFNRHDDYKPEDPGLTGTDYLNAQKIWKQNKNGGKPVMAVFVADVSGSMGGTPLNSLKKSLINALNFIGSEHYVGLVSYSSDVTVNLPIAEFDPTQRAYFSGETKNLSASGGTATYDAVLTGLKMLTDKAEEIPDAKPMLFVLTDGDQNEGYSLERIKGVVGGLQIPVYTIAYNYSNTGELEELSSICESAALKADSDDISNQLRNLFNVQM